MPTIAELLDHSTADALAALRTQAEQHQAEASGAPATAPVCGSCGRPYPPAPVVFRSGTEGGTDG